MKISRAVTFLFLFATSTVSLTQIERQDPAILLIAAIMQRWSSEGDFSGTVLVARNGDILMKTRSDTRIVNGTPQTTSEPNSKLGR